VKTPTSTDESPKTLELFFVSRKAREEAKAQGNKEMQLQLFENPQPFEPIELIEPFEHH